jgi:hypothetical protein
MQCSNSFLDLLVGNEIPAQAKRTRAGSKDRKMQSPSHPCSCCASNQQSQKAVTLYSICSTNPPILAPGSCVHAAAVGNLG